MPPLPSFFNTQTMSKVIDNNEQWKIKVHSHYYVIIANRFYLTILDGVLRLYVYEVEIIDIFVACHNSICGGHFAHHLPAQKALRVGYFWSIMFTNAHIHTSRCNICRYYVKNDLHMTLPLIPSLPLLPFEKWRINYVGLVHAMFSQGMAHIILVVDYLTKWVKTKVVKVTDKKTTTLFIFE